MYQIPILLLEMKTTTMLTELIIILPEEIAKKD
jgi:hypothetical protein